MRWGALALLLVVGSSLAHHPEYTPPKKLVILCVEPDNSLNYNLRSDPTSRRAGPDGEILFVYQLCRSA